MNYESQIDAEARHKWQAKKDGKGLRALLDRWFFTALFGSLIASICAIFLMGIGIAFLEALQELMGTWSKFVNCWEGSVKC